MTSLNHLITGQEGTIEIINGDQDQMMRLCALGFIPGINVVMYKKTSFDGPMIFDVQGAKIALRKFDASLVHVHTN